MERWVKALIIALMLMKLVPFALTWILFRSARYDSERERRKRVSLPGMLLNLLGNGTAAWGIAALVFHTRNPLARMADMLRMNCSWQDVGSLALTGLIGLLCGLAGGYLLRALFFREERLRVSRGRAAAALTLCLLCLPLAIIGESAALRSPHFLSIREVCRKTTVMTVDPDGAESLGSGSRKISYVTVYNRSVLNCEADLLWLSETEDALQAYPFHSVAIPAGGVARLTMDYDHGLDLKKGGGSFVFLSGSSGSVLDQVQLPALQENEAYACSAGDPAIWQVISFGEPEAPYVAPPAFSASSGFYPEPFDLLLSGEAGLTIRYTLDGSDPDEHSPQYAAPISIRDVSAQDNVWSALTDVSATFLNSKPRYKIPKEPVDKCAVVRAACFDAAGNRSEIMTASYFIGYDQKTGYSGLPVISLVTDPANLFDRDSGIYVLGKTFEEEYNAEEETRGWWWWPANYHLKGPTQERPVSLQLFDANRRLIMNKEAGVRIRGGASAGLLPKGLNLYARGKYDGTDAFPVDFWSTGFLPKRISLSAGGNDTELLVRDWLTARLAEGLGVMTTHFLPCSVFLDGEYWGVGMITERFDAEYLAFTRNIGIGDVALVKNGELEAGSEEHLAAYEEMLRFIVSNSMEQPENYAQACSMINVDNYLTYIALEAYVGNTDWNQTNNNAAWMNLQSEEQQWEWLLFDVNNLACYRDSEDDTLSTLASKSAMLRSLMKNPEFMSALEARLCMLAREIFTPERCSEALETYEAMMGEGLQKAHLRFYSSPLGDDQLEAIRTFLLERQAYILKTYGGNE